MTSLNEMRTFRSDCVNELQILLYRALLEDACQTSPRGMATTELLFVGVELTNPRRRLTTLDGRRWSPRLAAGEFCWNLRGEQSVESLAYYAPRWIEFADNDRKVRGSCYGHKIFTALDGQSSQWDKVVELLQLDPDSRRAVLSFHGQDFADRSIASGDVACVTSIQFLIRSGRLHAITTMRSNDVFWGFPYDVFVMTSLQELMASTLRLDMGSYYHQCGSLHFYNDKKERIKNVIEGEERNCPEMLPMDSPNGSTDLLKFEEITRKGGDSDLPENHETYWYQCCEMLTGS